VTLGCIQAISAGKGPLNNCQKAMVLCSILAALLEALFEETIKGTPPPPPLQFIRFAATEFVPEGDTSVPCAKCTLPSLLPGT